MVVQEKPLQEIFAAPALVMYVYGLNVPGRAFLQRLLLNHLENVIFLMIWSQIRRLPMMTHVMMMTSVMITLLMISVTMMRMLVMINNIIFTIFTIMA